MGEVLIRQQKNLFKNFKTIKWMSRELRLKWLFGNCLYPDGNSELISGCTPLREHVERKMIE